MPFLKVVTSMVVIKLTNFFVFLLHTSFFGGVVLTVVRRLRKMYSSFEGSTEVCCTVIVVETYFCEDQCTAICVVGFSGLSVSIVLFYAWELK